MKATLKNYHQAPRKVRLVADMIRGKSVPAARAALLFLPKKSTPAISKLLESAVANSGVTPDSLYIKTIAVNKGTVMRRARPFARGRAGTIRKAMSIITLELGTNATPSKKKARAKKTTVKKVKAETK
ncbi:MAG: 50S ribosomal protein L22 [Candidatus Pacebacteria bacterium]|nr:50S ribosomal protein L22 [Candidatus Paceibacterota bacterium]